jgi:hypothetical protein
MDIGLSGKGLVNFPSTSVQKQFLMAVLKARRLALPIGIGTCKFLPIFGNFGQSTALDGVDESVDDRVVSRSKTPL